MSLGRAAPTRPCRPFPAIRQTAVLHPPPARAAGGRLSVMGVWVKERTSPTPMGPGPRGVLPCVRAGAHCLCTAAKCARRQGHARRAYGPHSYWTTPCGFPPAHTACGPSPRDARRHPERGSNGLARARDPQHAPHAAARWSPPAGRSGRRPTSRRARLPRYPRPALCPPSLQSHAYPAAARRAVGGDTCG